MKLIEIVVHLFAQQIEDYAKLATAQLSSVAIWRPKTCLVQFTICKTPSDKLAQHVTKRFQQIFLDYAAPARVRVVELQPRALFRRAYGRNLVAKRTAADIVWFADADYIFGEGCLDAMAAVDLDAIAPHEMVFPGRYMMHNSHEDGDAELARITPGELHTPNLEPYFSKRNSMGIGGLQIVSRAIAHRGYCDGTRWAEPRKDDKAFPDTDDDRVYRGTISSSIPVQLPNLYRMRHSAASYESPALRKVRVGRKKQGKN